jgi:arsenate reductase
MTESVLFVCENNSILSLMAEAFLRRHGRAKYKVYSAGIEPKPVHLYTFQVMEEIGHDLYGYRAKSIFELNLLPRVDYLITLSDYVNDHFVFNENNIGVHLHWSFRNPLYLPGQEYGGFLLLEPFSLGKDQSSGQDEWFSSSSPLIKTVQLTKVVFQNPIHEPAPEDTQKIHARFRHTRDEMECQIMNFLEETGSGPLWWRG